MNNNKTSITTILISTVSGAFICWSILNITNDESMLRQQVTTLENRILDLELLLVQKEQALIKSREWSNDLARQNEVPDHNNTSSNLSASNDQVANNSNQAMPPMLEREYSEQAFDGQQVLKDLSTTSDRDPRSFSEKVIDLLAANPSRENIAIASQGMMEMANNTERLPGHALQSLYQNQSTPELKRIAAQVMSMRGDNSLMDKQINEARAGLRSQTPAERQKTLVELAKTRYAGAADVIAPLLQDTDTGVKLDALLALRATGNQSHVHLIEGLLNHPDPAVSWLANDVANNLQNLSDKARTRVASTDIAAELPVMMAPQ